MTGRSRTRANGEGSIFPYRAGYAAYTWVTRPDGTRTRKYVYGKTREAVHDKWITLQGQAKTGPMVTKAPTVADHLRYWLREVIGPNAAPLTFSTYETMARLYLIPGLGAHRLDRLSARDVQTWINALQRACQCCAQGRDAARPEARRRCCAMGKCCSRTLSARTISDLRVILRAALSHAMSEELVTRNVAKVVKVPSARSRKAQAWSSDEARAFLESARADGDPLYAGYVLVLVLGLRKGEVLGLRWEDVDLDRAELTVGFQLQRVHRQLLHRRTKTQASDATLPLPDICVSAMKIRETEWDAAMAAAGEAWQGTPLVLATRYGTAVEPRTFNRAWDARVQRAGVRKITVHDARRTCASLLADLDVHPRVAMEIMRHADFAVTMEIYTKVSSEATRSALRKLGERLT